MSNNPKWTEAFLILQDDGIWLQDAVERDEPVFRDFDEFKLRRIYTYIKMFKVMHQMIDDDICLIKKFDILFDALFEKYAIVALDKEWTSKDFLGVQKTLKNMNRINDRLTEYYEIINQDEQPMNDSDSETYEEIKEEINQKIYNKTHENIIKQRIHLRPFVGAYDIQKESKARTDILNEINEDNEITTKTLLKKVIDMRDENGKDILEMLIKTKTKSITIKFIDEQN
jgi:hypothetical protein